MKGGIRINMRVGSLVRYSNGWKKPITGIVTEVMVNRTLVKKMVQVYWSSNKMIWEYIDELEVIS